MSQTKLTFKQKLKLFFKRNMYAILVSGSVFILAVALLATSIVRSKLIEKQNTENNLGEQSSSKIENIDKVEAASPDQVVFNYPVKDYTLGETHNDTTLVYNKTLNEWTTHLGVDFVTDGESDVMASYRGKIESITYDTLTGTTVVIDHGEGLKTSYSSLNGSVVEVGQFVNAGDVIGKTSMSASKESDLGAHVHFETFLDGKPVNPMEYLGEK